MEVPASDAGFQRNAYIGLNDFSGSVRATQTDFFLHGRGIEELIGVGTVGEAAHDVQNNGAAGAIIPFFFLHWSENVTGFAAFGLAAMGLVIGSLLGRPAPAPQAVQEAE